MNDNTTDPDSAQLLRRIAKTVADSGSYVPTDNELATLGITTPMGEQNKQSIVSGRHAAERVSWSVYELETPDAIQQARVYVRYKTWRSIDGPGHAITGIGELNLEGVGVDGDLLRDKLEAIWRTAIAI
jgi:hypothetical protein